MQTLNPKNFGLRKRHLLEALFFWLFRGAALLNGLALFVVGYFILVNGAGAISWEFLTQPPSDSMTKGGILPCILGTFYLAVGALVFALPVGVASAVYMNEYAKKGRLLRMIRFGINNLAGALTLGVLTLPVIIGATEEALKAVPDAYRKASLALGATQWQTIYRVVLPAAMPEILTGAILGLGRAAGETAPIMFTAAVFFTPILPTSVFDQVMALPYHIYVLASEGTEIALTRPIQYGTALVLICLVCGMNLFAIITRSKMRKKLKR